MKNPLHITSNSSKTLKIIQKLQKILQNPIFSAIILIFFVLNIIILSINIKTIQKNKQLKSDNVTIAKYSGTLGYEYLKEDK